MNVKVFVLLCIALGGFALSRMLFRNRDSAQKADYRVALFQPAVHGTLDEIIQGFKESIGTMSKKTFTFTDYNATGNSTLLRAQAEEILQQNYDLIVTIGAHCSQTVHELGKKQGLHKPQVFVAVDDPISIGITNSLELSGTNVTGVLATHAYKEQIEALLDLKPDVKRILLVYNPAHGTGLEKDKKQIEDILSKKGISLHTVEVAHHNEIAQKATGFLENTDVVLVLMDNTVVAGLDSLIALCNRYGVLLYASDLSSGDKGAALSFGARNYDFGRLAAQLTVEILEHKKEPASLALKRVLTQHIKVNVKAMEKQGLRLTDEQLTQIIKKGGTVL
ncbi:ABC transporter substrate-binding protein [Candidatus Dependentiae bacterium]|nr:ABC transporter substrate-binding protein [Candidatus Dependentiae bacterium]